MGCLPIRVVLGLMETVQIRVRRTFTVKPSTVFRLRVFERFWPWQAFFTTTNVYLARVNLNIAITAMVIEKQTNGNLSSVVCEREYELRPPSSNLNSTLVEDTGGLSNENDGHDTFDWSNRQSGLMLGTGLHRRFIYWYIESCDLKLYLGGYFYGYAAMMPFAGFISAYFGVRRTMTIVMLISSLFSFAYTYIITVPNFG